MKHGLTKGPGLYTFLKTKRLVEQPEAHVLIRLLLGLLLLLLYSINQQDCEVTDRHTQNNCVRIKTHLGTTPQLALARTGTRSSPWQQQHSCSKASPTAPFHASPLPKRTSSSAGAAPPTGAAAAGAPPVGAALIPLTMSSTETFCSSLANRDGQKASTSTLAAFTRAEILSSCDHTQQKKKPMKAQVSPNVVTTSASRLDMAHSHRSASDSAHLPSTSMRPNHKALTLPQCAQQRKTAFTSKIMHPRT